VVLSSSALAIWGGEDAQGTPHAEGAVLRFPGLTWEKMPPAPIIARTRHGGAFIGSQLYIWGGVGGGVHLNNGAVYDVSTQTWTKLPEAPIGPRGNLMVRATGGRLLVWGGDDPSGVGVAADGALFDPRLQSWSVLPACPITGRSYCGADAAGGKLFVWGGYVSEAVDSGAEFDLDRREWKVLPKCELTARYDPGVLCLGSKVYVWAGCNGSDTSLAKDGAVFDAHTGAWTALPPLPFGSGAWALKYASR
jgi:N-acetylneuraminic acid mutarotase